jgi:hypothetical protein
MSTGSPRGAENTSKTQPYNIRVHNLGTKPINVGENETDILDPVPQLSGRGVSVSPPQDRPYVINNVIKSFRATSEVDRQRATQILDYIIDRRKMVERRTEEQKEATKEEEHEALL